MDPIRHTSFEAWLKFFMEGHSELGDDDPTWTITGEIALGYVTRLFENIAELLRAYGEEQINQSLQTLLNESHDWFLILVDDRHAEGPRIRCVNAIEQVFVQLFAVRCSPVLGHLDEPGARPLNDVCYMWWDIFPTWGQPERDSARVIDLVLLQVMSRILDIDHDACRESALHGLGHWHLHYPREVERIIDGFLAKAIGIRPELEAYAFNARQGAVL